MRFTKLTAFSKCIPFLAVMVFCSKSPLPVSTELAGAIEVRGQMLASLYKNSSVCKTAPDSLVLEVRGADMDPLRLTKKIDLLRPAFIDTFNQIPAGSSRLISLFAVDQKGVITHIDTTTERVVQIASGSPTTVNATLIPAAGSIYIQLFSLPTQTDSVFASFLSYDGEHFYEVHADKLPKMFLSINNIPHLTSGILTVALIEASGDTLYVAQKNLVFDARAINSVNLEFTTTGGQLIVDYEIVPSGVTLASYNFGSGSSEKGESGALLITEIMHAADKYEYIEIFNPGSIHVLRDTLLLDINGTLFKLRNINIAPKDYYVAGRYQNAAFDTVVADLDFVSTGNWIAIKEKDGSIIDQVIFTGSSNSLEWPVPSGKRALELNRTLYSVTANNLGRNWKISSELIEGLVDQCGTPGF